MNFVNNQFKNYLNGCLCSGCVNDIEFPVENTISIEVCRHIYRWLKRRKSYSDYYLYISWFVVREIINKCLYRGGIEYLYDSIYSDFESMMNEDFDKFKKCFDDDIDNVKKQLYKLSKVTESILYRCNFDYCKESKEQFIPFLFTDECVNDFSTPCSVNNDFSTPCSVNNDFSTPFIPVNSKYNIRNKEELINMLEECLRYLKDQ